MLKEYRAEFQKLDNTIKSIVWEADLKSKFTVRDNVLSSDCAEKFKQALKAFNELKKLNNIR